MAHLILLRNPLTPHDKEEHDLAPGETPIEWLQKHHPNGFGMPIRYYVNAGEQSLDDLDRMPDVDDIVIIALMPGGFLAAMPLLVKVIIGLAVMAAAFFAMQLFAPKTPKKKEQKEVETYSISAEQSAAEIGAPIPVLYGDVWMAPEYITQPFSWYAWAENGWNEWLSGVQFLNVIMCVGQGEVEVSNVRVGSSDAASLGAEVVAWRSFTKREHQGRMGPIAAAMGAGFAENVVTNAEVGNQEFIKQGDKSPYYTICKAGTQGSQIQIDVVFPNGLFYAGGAKGNMVGSSCSIVAWVREVDANGAIVGGVMAYNFIINAAPPALGDSKNKAEISNPIRRTVSFTMPKSGRWAVMLERISPPIAPDQGQTTFVWTGLKLVADNATNCYGDVTLLAVKIKASRGIGSDAAVRLTARCKRWMSGLPNGEWQHSTNPADAFFDVYTNTTYGAARPWAELDIPVLRDLKNRWAGYAFNYVFRDSTTVWEALKTIVVGQAAEPLPQGSFMSIAQDGVKPNRTMLFTDANIVEGSMKINYIFDVDDGGDGVEVSFVDRNDWHEVFARYPLNSVIPESVQLPGCADPNHAAQYARLVWQRTRSQRKRITFDTELEGIILNLGDRIAVSHEMPKWGDNGLVLAISGAGGVEITVDHDLDWSGGAKSMMFRTQDGSPSEIFSVTQGSAPNIAILGKPINFSAHYDDDFDYTSFVFGTATTMVRDFMVASTKHSGDTTVTVEAVNYAPEIFDGAMAFLGGNP